jgi:GT2 family glycosyltransferase
MVGFGFERPVKTKSSPEGKGISSACAISNSNASSRLRVMSEPPEKSQPSPAANTLSCEAHPSVSIIVCTLGNRPTLWGCLRSIIAQECHRFETIVVLNGPPDEGFAQAAAPYPLRLLNEPRRGVCAARNRAIPEARGEILVFADDDIIARRDWLHELLKGFEDPDVACVTGLVVPEGPVPHSAEKTARYFDGKQAQSAWTLSNAESGWLRKALGGPMGFGCNMAFRRTFLEKFALFPEDLGAGSMIGASDEFWMFVQVLKHGFRICHNPLAVVTHVFDAETGPQKQRMMQSYAGSVAFLLKLLAEEKSLRGNAVRWVLAGLRRRLRRVISRRSIASEPQELLTGPEKLRAYLRGPGVYWKSRRAAGRKDR